MEGGDDDTVWVTIDLAVHVTGVPAGTIRQWANRRRKSDGRTRIRSRRNRAGRVEYPLVDVVAADKETRRAWPKRDPASHQV